MRNRKFRIKQQLKHKKRMQDILLKKLPNRWQVFNIKDWVDYKKLRKRLLDLIHFEESEQFDTYKRKDMEDLSSEE